MDKREIKDKLVEIIDNERLITKKGRIETICRSQINRFSYEMILGDHCIFLKREKDGKVVYIETKCGKHCDGYLSESYIRAYKDSQEILGKLNEWYNEETLCVSEQAVG